MSPLPSEWIYQASLAIRAKMPIAVLHDQVALDKFRNRKET